MNLETVFSQKEVLRRYNAPKLTKITNSEIIFEVIKKGLMPRA